MARKLRKQKPPRVDEQELASWLKANAELTRHRHCDSYIEDPAAPEALRVFLAWARSPAHGLLLPPPHPKLFATVASDGNSLTGKRVRVVMASRFGYVGIHADHNADHGYQSTAHVADLTDFGTEP